MHRHLCLSFVLLFCALALRVSGHAPDGTEDRHHHIGRQCSSPCADCVLNPEQEEGPYYYDGTIVRSNIAETQVGVPLQLLITVVDTNTCDPLAGAAVDVWHCDASGVYSHVVNGAISTSSNGTIWLRGVQLADSTGLVTFYTVYPGWYSGRATHIHVKVHIGGSAAPNGSYTRRARFAYRTNVLQRDYKQRNRCTFALQQQRRGTNRRLCGSRLYRARW